MEDITRNGVKYEFMGRHNTRKEANELAKIWRARDRKTIVEKADLARSGKGYWLWVETW